MVSAQRHRRPELMDQPDLEAHAHRHALDSLGRGNRISRSVASLWPAIREAAQRNRDGALRILDLACGGGHMAVDLALRCAREGVTAEILGVDNSPVALDYARALAARAGVQRVTFTPLDVIRDPLPGGFDVLLCSLFMHHLGDPEAETLLRRMCDTAEHLVLVSDLRRTRLGYLLAWVGCRLLSRSRVFHVDGARSVEAAFSTAEIRRMAERCGLAGARIIERWPQRFLLTWRRHGES